MEHQTCTDKPQTCHLTTEEITNPFPLIENFFQIWHLAECRNLLREVLHQALSGYSHRDSINPADILYFLEELEKVTEAMWVIGERERAQRTEPMKTKPSYPTSFRR